MVRVCFVCSMNGSAKQASKRLLTTIIHFIYTNAYNYTKMPIHMCKTDQRSGKTHRHLFIASDLRFMGWQRSTLKIQSVSKELWSINEASFSDGEIKLCEALKLSPQVYCNLLHYSKLFKMVHTNDILWSKGGKATFPNLFFVLCNRSLCAMKTTKQYKSSLLVLIFQQYKNKWVYELIYEIMNA